MRARVASLTGADWLIAAETVASDTFAALATSSIVGFLSNRFGSRAESYIPQCIIQCALTLSKRFDTTRPKQSTYGPILGGNGDDEFQRARAPSRQPVASLRRQDTLDQPGEFHRRTR